MGVLDPVLGTLHFKLWELRWIHDDLDCADSSTVVREYECCLNSSADCPHSAWLAIDESG
jgi:hypothetical protein